MNKTRIDWPGLDYTWNPVVGCRHNCSYCYARKMNDRFKWIPNWTEPKFFTERLVEPYRLRKPSKIFVGSMCDLFGSWVDIDWINKILTVARENPRHTFMFLTKNPKGYNGILFPHNCQIGLTLTGAEPDLNSRLDDFSMNQPSKYRFLSIEPLLGSFEGVDLTAINLVIAGAMTGPGAIKPKKEWIESIKHPNIHYKDSIKPKHPIEDVVILLHDTTPRGVRKRADKWDVVSTKEGTVLFTGTSKECLAYCNENNKCILIAKK